MKVNIPTVNPTDIAGADSKTSAYALGGKPVVGLIGMAQQRKAVPIDTKPKTATR